MEQLQERASYNKEALQPVSQLIGSALRYNPVELAAAASAYNRARQEDTPTALFATEHVLLNLDDRLPVKRLEGVQDYLLYAIIDTTKIIDLIAQKYPKLSDDMLRTIMQNTETIDTIALLALRSNGAMDDYIDRELPTHGVLSPEGSSFIIMDPLQPGKTKGCPAAGSPQGVDTLPVFRAVVPWATELHLASEEWQAFRASESSHQA